MGDRGPKANQHLNLIAGKLPERPRPPKDLCKEGRRIWKEIVKAHPPDFFHQGALYLLFAFCEAAVVHAEACKEVKAHGLLIDGKQNPAIPIQTAKAVAMGQLACKLRLSPSAYRDRDSAGREGRKRPPKDKRSKILYGE